MQWSLTESTTVESFSHQLDIFSNRLIDSMAILGNANQIVRNADR